MDMNLQRSGIACLKELLKRMHLTPDWDGIVDDMMTALYDEDSVKALTEITEKMDYQPEIRDVLSLKDFNGPAVALLKNNHYVCIINCLQLGDNKVGLFNPRGQNGPQTVVLPTEQFLQITEGRCIIFNNLRDFDAHRHSSVAAIAAALAIPRAFDTFT